MPVGVPGDGMFGQSVKLTLESSGSVNRLSVATMLICTNDGFTGVDSLALPNQIGASNVRLTNGSTRTRS